MTKEQKKKLITAVVTFITTVLSILFLQACTMSMSIAKNNNGTFEQKQENSTSVDSTRFNNYFNK
jgi:outer membrane biogenesis lipoprotein LolB